MDSVLHRNNGLSGGRLQNNLALSLEIKLFRG